MAYPTVSAPYGLKPINLYGGTPFAGATRQYKIASAYNTSIFYGDVVEMCNNRRLADKAFFGLFDGNKDITPSMVADAIDAANR